MQEERIFHARLTTGITPCAKRESTLYIGCPEGLRYIAPFIEQQFFDTLSRSGETTISEAEIISFIEHSAASLIVIMLEEEHLGLLSKPKDLMTLARIHQITDTSGTVECALSKMSKRETRRRAQSIANGFTYEVSESDDDFYYFYRTMHTPTMTSRYREQARSVPEDIAYKELFRKGQLFKIYLNQQWVAGSVCQIDEQHKMLNARLIGVQQGEQIFKINGAQNFVYHSIIHWACQASNIDTVDFQGCEPFLTKGTFQYKKRFGTRAVLPNNNFGKLRIIIRISELSASTRRFLINNPTLVMTENNDLAARYFQDSKQPYRADIPFECEGLEKKIVLDLDKWYG